MKLYAVCLEGDGWDDIYVSPDKRILNLVWHETAAFYGECGFWTFEENVPRYDLCDMGWEKMGLPKMEDGEYVELEVRVVE